MAEINSSGLKLVLPAKGRLKDAFDPLLVAADLRFNPRGDRIDFGLITDLRGTMPPIEVLLERPDDALQTLADGAADLAVVGRDTCLEFNAASGMQNIPSLLQTFNGVAACRICIAGRPDAAPWRERDLNGLRFATSVPGILERWLAAREITPASVLVRSGGVEATVEQGRADVICDLVQSGNSLRANGLVEKFVVENDICAVIAGRAGLCGEKKDRADALLQRLNIAATPEYPVLTPQGGTGRTAGFRHGEGFHQFSQR